MNPDLIIIDAKTALIDEVDVDREITDSIVADASAATVGDIARDDRHRAYEGRKND